MASENKVLAAARIVLITMLALMAIIAVISLFDYGMAPEEYRFGTPVTGWQRAGPAVFVVTNAISIASLIAGTVLLKSRMDPRKRTFALCFLAFLSLVSLG